MFNICNNGWNVDGDVILDGILKEIMKQNDKPKWTQTRITHIFETQQLTN